MSEHEMEEGEGSMWKSGAGAQAQRIRWQPNEQYLEILMGMGISRNAAEKALYYTGNHSADLAAAYVFDNPDGEDLDAPLCFDFNVVRTPRKKPDDENKATVDEEVDEDDDNMENYKMVFVVNTELQMGVGKIASQVAHAAVGLYRQLLNTDAKNGETLLHWEDEGEKKVVLRGQNYNHLINIEKEASFLNLPTCIIQDAGLTQVVSRATTVISIFGKEDLVNQVTRDLHLL